VTTGSHDKILSGLRVLDFTDALAGPFCARYLADCGCEVINVERPDGKVARFLPYFKDGHCAEYIQNHCGKKSIALDLKAEGARDLILELVRVSDIVLENFRPGVMAGLKLDYPALKEVNPAIIMCSISGWGQTGPQAEMIGVDLLVQASRGIAHMSTKAGERPNFVGFAVSDILAALNAFGAICAALYRRSITGEGEYIDIAMADCALASLGNAFGTHILSKGKDEMRYMVGSFSPSMSPNGAYKGRDGYLVVFVRTDELWALLTKVMGKPELATDPRFNTVENRLKHNEEVTEIMDEWVQQFERVSDVAALLQSHHILASPVLSIAQVIEEDPQSKAREMIAEMPHPTLGPFKYLNTPLRFQNSKAYVDEPPPVAIGEHTEYVLRNVLRLDDEEIKKLRKERVVFGPENQTTL
jgi:crotonobetainyl-CoA:carnitine CoA-transferase CaiB-like acyl-CoA transferase